MANCGRLQGVFRLVNEQLDYVPMSVVVVASVPCSKRKCIYMATRHLSAVSSLIFFPTHQRPGALRQILTSGYLEWNDY
jgi:hypothetical protein